MNDTHGQQPANSVPVPSSGAAARLADALMKLKARESGGIVGADRYDYQKDWALCKILELHMGGADYVVVCEFHEDITILDHPVDPSKVTFYQIKTAEKSNWTVQRLIFRRKGSAEVRLPSILGNLCGKSAELGGCEVEFRFASNAKYSIKSVSGTSLDESTAFLCVDINDADRKKLKTALAEELANELPDSFEHTLGFEVADLALLSHWELATGKLAVFLDKYAAGCTVHTASFYRALFDELRRRTVAKRPKTLLADVCDMKGISRARFDGMLKDAIRSTPVDRTLVLIQQDLIAAGIPIGLRLELLDGVRKYFVRRLNPNDVSLQRFRRRALTVTQSIMDSNPGLTLPGLAEDALAALWPSEEIRSAQLSQTEIKALVMVELYERRESEVPEAGPESPQAQS